MRIKPFILHICLYVGIIILGLSCNSTQNYQQYKANTYDFPSPVDTKDHSINIQKKRIFGEQEDGVFASNKFDGARLNEFVKVNDTLYKASIFPENQPINDSPWYAFKLWSNNSKNIYVELNYSTSKHRYFPKLSRNGKAWQKIAMDDFVYMGDSTRARLKIEVGPDTLWVAAQEIITSKMVANWGKKLESEKRVSLKIIGKSRQERPLLFMDITQGKKSNKETIVLLCRQHPPEVTGYLAMQAFVQELLDNSKSSLFFKKYRVMIYPLLNPDGVDMGHWRHNAGGVDLNRDWAYYHQPEVRQIANHIVSEVKNSNNEVIIGIDFHSTWHDVYYTLAKDEITTSIPSFRDQWFNAIEAELGDNYQINEVASGLGTPVAKGWFFTQFGAEGITYEVGDSTPREFIKKKGKVSAQALINVLLEGKYR